MADIEDLKIHEAHEHAEIGHADKKLAPVSLSMAILAVLVAAISLLGHRAHEEVLLAQTRANFQQAELVGLETQQHADTVLIELLGVMSIQNAAQETALKERFNRETARYTSKRAQVKAEEQRLEMDSARYRKKANRLDVGELFCELALVLCSITLLTRQRSFWIGGIIAGALGIITSVTAFFVG